MGKMQVRARAVAAAALVLAPVALSLGRPCLERWLQQRIEHEARRHGVVAHLEAVRIGVWPPLAVDGLRLERPGAWSLGLERLELWLRPAGRGLLGRLRLAMASVTVNCHGGLALRLPATLWDVDEVSPEGWRAELREPVQGLAATWLSAGGGTRLELSANGFPAGRLLDVRRREAPLLDAGVVSGRAMLARAAGSTDFVVRAHGSGVRLAALSGEVAVGWGAGFGLPTDLDVALEGSWRPAAGALEVTHWAAKLDGATLDGTLSLADVPEGPRVDLALDVRRVEFARLLRTSGVRDPVAIPASVGTADYDDLGAASLSARAVGRLSDPASFSVTQRLDFSPPRDLPAALLRLRGDFAHEVTLQDGVRRSILVSPESPDFVSLGDVPPLFIRTLLLAEDAGFYGHRGIDLAELPSALLTNWARGGAFRGASTLTQQLAKNLFLSREKRLGRKLQELSLALLLEATLDKRRLLEIYLNVIEWGPDLCGLRPAARRYFRVEPAALTPSQMAFLVALIPGPVKYQAAFKSGTPAPGFRSLIDDLLEKLRAVGALSEQEYQAACEDALLVEDSRPAPGTTSSEPIA